MGNFHPVPQASQSSFAPDESLDIGPLRSGRYSPSNSSVVSDDSGLDQTKPSRMLEVRKVRSFVDQVVLLITSQRKFCDAFGSPKLSARQHADMMAFFDLLESESISKFLRDHPCFDRYYIASVYVYFQRANLHAREYNARKFAMALHIANAMKVGLSFFN